MSALSFRRVRREPALYEARCFDLPTVFSYEVERWGSRHWRITVCRAMKDINARTYRRDIKLGGRMFPTMRDACAAAQQAHDTEMVVDA